MTKRKERGGEGGYPSHPSLLLLLPFLSLALLGSTGGSKATATVCVCVCMFIFNHDARVDCSARRALLLL